MPRTVDLSDLVVRDGVELHHRVPPQRWCVTKADLVQFCTLVRQHVAEGKILPSELDNFDANDHMIGPNFHTVNAQLVRPFTEKVGKMSWALMLHPEGLACDLFITHSWQEGIYEFIGKVLKSWPRGAHHAYCCVLSNPQNLDIGSLLGSPMDSPFAKALRVSTYMLVVPNQTCSIYSRIWCAYEAYLAYSESKLIIIATGPVPGMKLNLSLVLAVMAIAFAASTAMRVHFKWTPSEVLLSLIYCVCALSVECMRPSTFMRIMIFTVAFCIGLLLGQRYTRTGEMIMRTDDPCMFVAALSEIITHVGMSIGAVSLEADRLWLLQANEESHLLRFGYTGKLRDAQASQARDRELILDELVASGHEEDVNSAIEVLLDSGVFSPVLKTVYARAGKMEAAGYWSLSEIVLLTTLWLYACSNGFAQTLLASSVHCKPPPSQCLNLLTLTTECGASRDLWLADHCHTSIPYWVLVAWVLELVILIMIFMVNREDTRGFVLKASMRILVTVGLLVLVAPCFLIDPGQNLVGLYITFAGAAPVVLLISVMGPGLIAQLPLVGPWLVKILMRPIDSSSFRCSHKAQVDQEQKSGVDLEEQHCLIGSSSSSSGGGGGGSIKRNGR